MDELATEEQLRAFILGNRVETDEEFVQTAGPCFGLSWKRDHWVVKMNNRKVASIGQKDLPRGFDLKAPAFISNTLTVLRQLGIDGLSKYLKALRKNREAA